MRQEPVCRALGAFRPSGEELVDLGFRRSFPPVAFCPNALTSGIGPGAIATGFQVLVAPFVMGGTLHVVLAEERSMAGFFQALARTLRAYLVIGSLRPSTSSSVRGQSVR